TEPRNGLPRAELRKQARTGHRQRAETNPARGKRMPTEPERSGPENCARPTNLTTKLSGAPGKGPTTALKPTPSEVPRHRQNQARPLE
ncbi:MAG: hypothetical protein ACRERV_15065, partial [Methylococcales bacterium]